MSREPRLVISDTTFRDEIQISDTSSICLALAAAGAAWAPLLAAHLRQWCQRHHRGSRQHDGLALSAALRLPFVDFDLTRVRVAPDGRMRRDPAGVPVWVSTGADYPGFMRWFERGLVPVE